MHFDRFMADDLAMVQRIYQLADQAYSDRAARSMGAFMDAHPRGRHGGVHDDLARLGIDETELRSSLAFYTERFGSPGSSRAGRARCDKLDPVRLDGAVGSTTSERASNMAEPGSDGNGGNGRLGGGAIASLVGVGLLVIFIAQNTEKIRLHFLVWHFSWPLWLYTIVVAVFGALIWFGLGVMRRHRRRKERRQDRRD